MYGIGFLPLLSQERPHMRCSTRRNLMCPDCVFGDVFLMSIFKRINVPMAVLDPTWRSAYVLDIQKATKDGNSIIQLPRKQSLLKGLTLMKDISLVEKRPNLLLNHPACSKIHLLLCPFPFLILILPLIWRMMTEICMCRILGEMIWIVILHLQIHLSRISKLRPIVLLAC